MERLSLAAATSDRRSMGMATAPAATMLPTFCSSRSSSTLSSSVPLPAMTSRASIQILQQQSASLLSPNSPSLRNSSLVAFQDSPGVMEALREAAAVTLAGATARAVRNVVPSAQVLRDATPTDAGGALNPDAFGGEIQPARCHQKVSASDGRRWRRVRRQRKRKYSELKDDAGSHTWNHFSQKCSAKPTRSGYLTTREEAEFSFYLKEWARIEADTKKLCKMSEDDVDPLRPSAPKASLLGRRNAERILLKAMECRERIVLSYKRLVVSIATPYEGKGLSLQDLVQVDTHANHLVAQIHPS